MKRNFLSKFEILFKDELFRGSLTLIIMIGFFNFFNYLFQIFMARMLTLPEYSIFAVLMSLIYITGIPSETIQTIITQGISNTSGENKIGKMKHLIATATKRGVFYSMIIFIIAIPFLAFFSRLTQINFWLLVLTMVTLFSGLVVPITRGVFQGRKKFFVLGLNLNIESILKLLFAIFLFYMGFSVFGAIGAILISAIIAWGIGFIWLKDILKSKSEVYSLKNPINKESLKTFLIITSIILLYSLDVIFARMFFSPEISGEYAFISLIGKTVLFVNFAIGKTLLPLSSERFENKSETGSLIKKALITSGFVSLIAVILFLIIPKPIIYLLSLGSTKYLGASNILFLIGLAYALLSITYLIVLYNISIKNLKKFSIGLPIAVIFQIILFFVFNQNPINFSLGIVIINGGLLIYTILTNKK